MFSQWNRVGYLSSAAQETLQRTVLAGKTRQHFAGLQHVPPLPPVPASHHLLTPVGVVGFSVPCRGRPVTFGTLLTCQLGKLKPQGLSAPPPGPPGAGGARNWSPGAGCPRFFYQQLEYWAAHASDP